MSSLEERVALLEGRVQDQATFITMIHTASAELRQSMRELSTELRGEMAALGVELRGEMATVRTEIATVRTEMATVHADVAGLRTEMRRGFDRMDQHFGWLVGIAVTIVIAASGAFWTLLQSAR